MRQEAIELIVALKGHTLPKGAKNAYNRLCKAIEQASSVSSIQSDKTSDAEKQEPVAWMHTKIEGVAVPHRPADLDKHPDRWEALYKTPPPCPTCEALARTVMMDQTAHDTAPPQRKPLTDEEILTVARNHYNSHQRAEISFARAIEAAHGIKE